MYKEVLRFHMRVFEFQKEVVQFFCILLYDIHGEREGETCDND